VVIARLGSTNDAYTGTTAADSIYGGAGNDTLRGGNGNDRVFGEFGNDRIYGDAGDDVMNGGDGTDSVYGGLGADNIGGGLGNDRLDAGVDTSRDTLLFVVDTASAAGRDTIYNFDDGEDKINLGRFGSAADIDSNGDGRINELDDWVDRVGTGNLRLDVGGAFGADFGFEQTLTVVGDTDLATGDFIFV
jgi:Ca2+-binding RTX toxin-like protein